MDYSKKPGYKIKNKMILKNKIDPIVSIITPFYNGGNTIIETAQSVFNQTYPFFEWIIVDDGSKDKQSLEMLDTVSKMDSRVKVYHNENGGPSVARDYGISKSSKSSKYVFFLDCDDIIDETMLECLYWTLETHSDASFAYTTMVNFGDREFIWEQYLTVEREKYENVICISSMVKKDDLLEVGCFGITEKSMYEDWNLWLKLLEKGKKPIRVNAPLFWYRISNTGEFSRAKKNNSNAMKYVNETAGRIDNDVDIIQFPNSSDSTFDGYDSMSLPFYKKSDKKNILYIFPWMVVGGADIFNLELIKRLDPSKYNSFVVTTLPSENPLFQNFNEFATIYDMASFLSVRDYLYFVDYLIKSRNIDIVFVSNSTHGYAMLPYIKTKYPNISVIDYVHSVDFKDKNGGFGKYTRDFDLFIDQTYVCNKFTKGQLQQSFNKKNVDVIYIGTDVDRFDSSKFNKNSLMEKYSLPKDKRIITFLARLSEEKRPQLFIDIAYELLKKRKDLFFLVVGDGPLYSSVCKRIKKYNLQNNVKMFGVSDCPEEIYSVSDVTVNCSSLEGLALTSYESLSMGVPVVSTSVGGQTELIDENVGRIVEYGCDGEIDCYVDSILDVLNKLQTLSNNSRKKIVNNYTYDLMVNKFDNIFSSIKCKKIFPFDMNFSLGIYETYVDMLYKEFDWIVNSYIEKKYGVIETNKSDNSIKTTIKNIFKKFGFRYNCAKELRFILNTYRLFHDMIVNFKCAFINLFKFIIFMFVSLFYIIVIFLKFLRKRLGD